MSSLFAYYSANIEYVAKLLYNHIQYTFIAIAIAILIAVPLGIIIFNYKNFNKPVLSIANIIQAIPSLSLLGLVMPILGIGAIPGVFVVVLYSILPILKNTYTGLANINRDTLEAAKGIGMTNTQILFKVQIPLALPVIMAGIRISSVTAVGLLTIAAYIGTEVLGTLVISGIHTMNTTMMLAGAIPACILALTMDLIMAKVEKAATPISLQLKSTNITPESIASLKRSKRTTIAAVVTTFAIIIGVMGYSSLAQEPDIVVGSKEAVEGRVVGNLIADMIEYNTDLKIERKLGLGGTMVAFNALTSGEIDIYPEYSGSLYSAVLGNTFVPGTSSDEVFEKIRKTVRETDNLYVLDHLNFNNTYVLAVKPETAEQYSLETMSDLSKVSSRLLLGCSPEFAVREDGYLGMSKMYDMYFEDTPNFTGTLMYTAIENDEVDVITAFSTDSLVAKQGLSLLEDDLGFFPPYNMFPLVNEKVYEQYPEVEGLMKQLSDALDDETMSMLNGRVVEEGLDAAQVSKEFLLEKGLIPG